MGTASYCTFFGPFGDLLEAFVFAASFAGGVLTAIVACWHIPRVKHRNAKRASLSAGASEMAGGKPAPHQKNLACEVYHVP
jgi:hypothetical protein